MRIWLLYDIARKDMPMLLKPAEAAARIGVAKGTYHYLRTRYGLPSKRRGYIDPSVLDAWWKNFLEKPVGRRWKKASAE